jgi:hypothetical protein
MNEFASQETRRVKFKNLYELIQTFEQFENNFKKADHTNKSVTNEFLNTLRRMDISFAASDFDSKTKTEAINFMNHFLAKNHTILPQSFVSEIYETLTYLEN